ncbi:MAG: low molecular weight protein-tyrosine-phosphatase [Halocynthiibacter sp.]
MTTRILFVCLGNICRSPTAEAVFRALSVGYDVHIDSCGTSNWHVGEPAYGPMQAQAQARGYDLSPLRARQLCTADFTQFDMIIAMDRDNLKDIEACQPKGSTAQLHLMSSFAPNAGFVDMPDPYYTRNFDQVVDFTELAARGVLDYIPAQ